MGSGAVFDAQASGGIAGYQRPLVFLSAAALRKGLNRSEQERRRYAWAVFSGQPAQMAHPKGLMKPGLDPDDSGQSDAVRLC